MRFLFTQPLGSRQIAKYYGCCDTMFVHPNHLGSTTMITNAAGTVMRDLLFYPYGQTWRNIGNNWDLHFASLWQREFASGLDPTPNRMYHSRLFRWMTPDEFTGGPTDAVNASVGGADPTPPGPLPYADITNPQSLNKYAYVYNNPLRYTDPTGRWCVFGKIGSTCTPPPPSIVKAPPPPPPWKRGNPLYPSKDQAGKAAVHASRAAAAQRPVEWGNQVVKVGKVGWTHGDPVTQGSRTTVDPDASVWTGERPATPPTKENPLPMAPGLTKEGEAHVQPNLPGYYGDRFSISDMQHARGQGVTSYLGPTQGGVLKYDPNTEPYQSWVEPPE